MDAMDIDAIRRFAQQAGFIFHGRVYAERPTDAPELPSSAGDPVAVRIESILRSTEVMGGLAGSDAILVTPNAQALKTEQSMILFTDCVSLGRKALLREVGHVEASSEALREVSEAVRQVEEQPLRDRVAAAELIVTGEVVARHLLERSFPPSSEHDPEWGIARVAVEAALKGRKPRGEVEVLFANSIDIVWYRSPKLPVGAKGIFLLHRPTDPGRPSDLSQSVYQATDPLDFLPEDRRGEIERMIGRGEH